MTDISSMARFVGAVRADGGELFEEDGIFYMAGSTMVITADDVGGVRPTSSADFPALEAFLKSLLRGVRFVAVDGEGQAS